jgi:predicted transposase/invertase (TIGR01784 family)
MNKVNPKIDLVFKKLFGTEQNISLLKSLVNSILPNDEQVTTLELKNPYNPSDYLSGKISYLDIKATDENGKWYDIEIQVAPYDFFGMRLLFYWAKMYSSQLKSKQTYEDLRKTIVISLINFDYFVDPEGQERYHRRIGLTDLDTREMYEQTNGLELIFVELKKFRKELPEINTTLERWITFLNRAHEYSTNSLPTEIATEEIIKAMEELEIMYFNDVEQEHYESQQRRYMDEMSIARQKEREHQLAENKIRDAVFNRNAEIARQMKMANEPVDKIARFTSLTTSQIDKL